MKSPLPKFTPSHPSAPWRVYFRGRDYWLKTEAEAKKKAKEIAGGNGAFSARELDDYRHARQLLGSVPLLSAVRHYLERQSGEQDVTVSAAIERHMKSLDGRPHYLKKKKYYLGKLEDSIGEKLLRDVPPTQIEDTVNAFKSDWMKNDFLKHSRIFFRYCIKLRLTRNDPTFGMTERKVTPSKVILSLTDTDHLLTTCRESLARILPAVALQLFMGIRTSEVCRLEWDSVRVGEFVDISSTVAKTHERRVIDWWPPRLTQFIVDVKKEGTVVPHPDGYERAKWELVQLCKKSKKDFKWGQNAPRHSYASYAVAHWQDAGRVALWMGQRDVNILFRYYRNYRSQVEGSEFFGVISENGGTDVTKN